MIDFDLNGNCVLLFFPKKTYPLNFEGTNCVFSLKIEKTRVILNYYAIL